MKDVNSILREKIYLLLEPVLNCNVYQYYAPAHEKGPVHVTINAISNVDASTMNSNDTDTTIQIGIYSKDSQANPGQLVNDVAASVYAMLYPNRQTLIDLEPEFQTCGISLVNDVTPDAILTNNNAFINRFLTFRFTIFHR